MAPKTRHLAQGKRKRPNRVPQTLSSTPQAPVAASTGDAPIVTRRTTIPVAVEEERASEPAAVRSTLRPDVARRESSVRTARPYQAANRARATMSSDAHRPAMLPRATEYAFIRSDMRRLLLTAGTLAILMIVLLLLLDG